MKSTIGNGTQLSNEKKDTSEQEQTRSADIAGDGQWL